MQKKNDLVFISTFVEPKFIDNLINSVVKHNSSLSVYFIIINQTAAELLLPVSEFISFHQIITKRLSLSSARNLGINYLINNDIEFGHIMFPDDDSTFDSNFFDKFNKHVNCEKNYLIDVYCQDSTKLFKENNYENNTILNKYNYDAAMSVNMIICKSTFLRVGLFDEQIGVGAKYGAGEDYDFYIRCCDSFNGEFIYQKFLYNFHPSNSSKFSKMNLRNTISKYVKYGNGTIFMFCKHKMYFVALKTCFRALGGALVSLIKIDIKLFITFIIVFFTRLRIFFLCFFRLL